MDKHDVLNILGLLPVVGPVFDACNAACYATEGEWGKAAMSLLFMIPGTDLVGTAAKVSPYLGKFGKYVTSTAKFVKLVDTGTMAGVTAYQTGKKIANLIDTYATEGKDIDVNFFLQLGEIGLGLAATASFGKTLASDLEKYTTLNEKLEYAANAIKKEANRLAKDNTGTAKLPGKTIDGDALKPSTTSDSSSVGKSEAGSSSEGGSKSKWWHEGYVDNLSETQIILGVKQSDKGLSTLGSSSRQTAMSAGKAWVGENYRTITDNHGNVIGYSSSDGMRAFRIQYKNKEGIWRANFQENIMVNNPYPNIGQHRTELKNVHIDIFD